MFKIKPKTENVSLSWAADAPSSMTVSQLQNADLTAKVISDGQVAENGKVSYTYKKKTFLWFSSKMSGVPTEPGTYTQTAKAGGNYSCGSISRTITVTADPQPAAEHPATDIGSTIVNKFATDEFAAFAAKTYEYAQKGFISPSCQSTATANDYRSATQSSGEYLFGTQSYAFGYELDASEARGIDVRMVPETAAYMDCTSGQGAMVAISATSKNP